MPAKSAARRRLSNNGKLSGQARERKRQALALEAEEEAAFAKVQARERRKQRQKEAAAVKKATESSKRLRRHNKQQERKKDTEQMAGWMASFLRGPGAEDDESDDEEAGNEAVSGDDMDVEEEEEEGAEGEEEEEEEEVEEEEEEETAGAAGEDDFNDEPAPTRKQISCFLDESIETEAEMELFGEQVGDPGAAQAHAGAWEHTGAHEETPAAPGLMAVGEEASSARGKRQRTHEPGALRESKLSGQKPRGIRSVSQAVLASRAAAAATAKAAEDAAAVAAKAVVADAVVKMSKARREQRKKVEAERRVVYGKVVAALDGVTEGAGELLANLQSVYAGDVTQQNSGHIVQRSIVVLFYSKAILERRRIGGNQMAKAVTVASMAKFMFKVALKPETIRRWVTEFIKNGFKFNMNWGKTSSRVSLTDDLELQGKARTWVRLNRARRGRPNMRAFHFQAYLNEVLFTDAGVEVSLSYAKRFLLKLGFRPCINRKGIYNDGHERPDVELQREKEFLPFMSNASDHMTTYNDADCKVETPRKLIDEAEWVLCAQDECVVASNDDQNMAWSEKGSEAVSRPKGEGAGVMMSCFTSEKHGVLRMSDEQFEAYNQWYEKQPHPRPMRLPQEVSFVMQIGKAHPGIAFGVPHAGYWKGDNTYAQTIVAIGIFEWTHNSTIKVWKASTGELLRTLEGHSASVMSVAVAAKLDMIVSTGLIGETLLWDIATGQEVNRDAVPATRDDSGRSTLLCDGAYRVSLLGCTVGFSTDAAVGDCGALRDIVALGDKGGGMHFLERVN